MNTLPIYITNANIVLAEDVLTNASLLIENGLISAINPENIPDQVQTVDAQGKTVMPGMIDLHCDALEKEVEPRPNVHFPIDFACAQADKRNAGAGITTVYHALSFANEELGVRNNQFAKEIAEAVHQFQPHALVDNRVHCRYEITDPTGLPILMELMEKRSMHLVSLMDHTPGQGQFKDLAAYKAYFGKSYQKSDAELDQFIAQKQQQAEGAMERVEQLVKMAHAQGISVASHDDDCKERVDTMTALGVDISEFPINMETAEYARAKGMKTIMGAPNILRGKSQSGSMRALDAVNAGVCDCLCADYSPATLIMAVFKLAEVSKLTLAQAIQLVTKNPAEAAKLHDRGVIEVGKRADIIMIANLDGLVQVSDVFVEGVLAFKASYDHA
ncbi:MAG: alpha-D-ribose 1-methylphosphonate 5-triphosphate diphosphatase [Piscirickettsiaceae bacterium CG_4_9_14_3_um_filter_43_564]|jgi:alpha-D-ribose 1-methylphosphonate 5-triphosphate diphosphatase|uniref:Alpha-D-ribose 1-methylphosphonate 5-triphosphate diphosphatase n=2 Tax=Hydrogenovibrio crunogenus TaxID=39765 RepID=A0A4P7P1X2_9GAMM|nr:alpha-D-ribose 1-methylphosphonate 5-triphosphate diphosphatase [Hydrogenovibrio crunogenus]NCN44241.1 alpha-D-ribose 1-methylphosphonate 5-triphosphate diphosphatase [Thiomicrospira sp.]PJA66159.1 MAG: alpha-D-ribose 1-methylphosphonate 5-triphosphate diphosphatase [Piscirickettsiaceae bacterium CG_4_9_14_3_um_filter_43_564]NCN67359.1 alpha-D-ribose 1-methylphosphonate 5-triphosphate diphosphatase [Thiomicrospira sp.]NCO13599.1 alpha-D-ribose 1-methylphosphonate 5-triphosphate diphosphatase